MRPITPDSLKHLSVSLQRRIDSLNISGAHQKLWYKIFLYEGKVFQQVVIGMETLQA